MQREQQRLSRPTEPRLSRPCALPEPRLERGSARRRSTNKAELIYSNTWWLYDVYVELSNCLARLLLDSCELYGTSILAIVQHRYLSMPILSM